MFLTNDKVVLSSIILTTVAAGVLLWRRRAGGRAFGAAMPVAFTGVTLTLMMAAHCVEIGYRVAGGVVDGMPPLRYDFRAYSLQLLGVLMMWLGVRAVIAAGGIARGEAGARGAAFRPMLGVLALSAPIIPIHPFFGPLGTGLALIGLAGVALAPRVPPPARTPAATGQETAGALA